MATIRQVAQLAGVGVGTVSRALNRTGYVAENTRQKIMEAVDELGYKPNELARNLFRNRSGIVGVMVPDLEHPFFARLLRYIEIELSKHDCKCLVCNTIDIMNRQQDFLNMLEHNTVDGIITCVDALPDFNSRNGKAIVCMDRNWGPDVPMVRSDHDQGGTMAGKAFLKAGCKKIIQFSADLDYTAPTNYRYRAMNKVLQDNGCEVVTIVTEWDALSYAYNKNIIWKYLDIIRTADGLLANDIGAMSCITVAQKVGIKVPEQLRIIGYDGTEMTNLTYPELACIVQDCVALAKCCVDMVLDMVDGNEPESMEVLFPVSWKQGGTV